MNCKIFINKALKETLATNNTSPKDYQPAYGGESVGLDLYNTATDMLIIPPASWSIEDGFTKETWEWVNEQSPSIPFNSNLLTQKELESKVRKFAEKTLIPTGLHIALPKNYVGLILERGSITKTPLKVRAGVIDPGYTGEVFVNIVNLSSDWVKISPQTKLPVQLVVMPVSGFAQVSESEYQEYINDANRLTGMVGSSD